MVIVCRAHGLRLRLRHHLMKNVVLHQAKHVFVQLPPHLRFAAKGSLGGVQPWSGLLRTVTVVLRPTLIFARRVLRLCVCGTRSNLCLPYTRLQELSDAPDD